ncbi:MAG: SufE family protein [Flavobacteriales bacterium]|nr:SufE family protein [Flavobacteriales bacterium]MCB9195768.1 SufE family protein [Flavobacteriales bacterium]MCB9198822.1 SufE family protein [Flavobacteriales bacterium]
MTIQEKGQEVVEEFELFDDWMEKYEHIIELGKDLPIIEDQYKTDDNLIKGCQSKVWVWAEFNNGRINFTADSEAIITKGIIALLVRVLNNSAPEEVLKADFEFIKTIGLQDHLSPTRANGLLGMIKRLKELALQNCE